MNKGDTLIWDQTNVVKSARIKKLKPLIEKGYVIIGLTFEIPEEEWQKRIEKREKEGGKVIPKFVINKMKKLMKDLITQKVKILPLMKKVN